MPFDKKFNDIYTYGIKQSCTELNTYCERVDEQIYKERILDRIYNQISKADIIIADMTGRNANVFYEVGYAHALGKNVILLTQNAEDIPFDLKHFPHIIYNGQITKLGENLKTRLDWFLNAETVEEITNFDFGLEFLINGNKIEEGKNIQISEDDKDSWLEYFNLKIDIFNASSKTYKSKFKIGLEGSIHLKGKIEGLEEIMPSNEKVLFISKEITNVYPQAFKSIDFKIKQSSTHKIHTEEKNAEVINLILKVFTNLELRQINFSLTIPQKNMPLW